MKVKTPKEDPRIKSAREAEERRADSAFIENTGQLLDEATRKKIRRVGQRGRMRVAAAGAAGAGAAAGGAGAGAGSSGGGSFDPGASGAISGGSGGGGRFSGITAAQV